MSCPCQRHMVYIWSLCRRTVENEPRAQSDLSSATLIWIPLLLSLYFPPQRPLALVTSLHRSPPLLSPLPPPCSPPGTPQSPPGWAERGALQDPAARPRRQGTHNNPLWPAAGGDSAAAPSWTPRPGPWVQGGQWETRRKRKVRRIGTERKTEERRESCCWRYSLMRWWGRPVRGGGPAGCLDSLLLKSSHCSCCSCFHSLSWAHAVMSVTRTQGWSRGRNEGWRSRWGHPQTGEARKRVSPLGRGGGDGRYMRQ